MKTITSYREKCLNAILLRVEINIFELNNSNQNHSKRVSLLSLIIEKESKDITVNTSIFNSIFLCGVSSKVISYE